jgi:hypothetical protein
LLRRVVWQKFKDVSRVLAASIIRALIALMMEAALRIVGKFLPEYTAQQPRTQPSLLSLSLRKEPETQLFFSFPSNPE